MKNQLIQIASFFLLLVACNQQKSPQQILQQTIAAIDTLKTISYKQDMVRTNPRNLDDTLKVYREMVFKRLCEDSIVGCKGHWYFYNIESRELRFEEIYDGRRMLRKSDQNRRAVLFNLCKYPAFRKKHFWGHNTPYAMQFTFKQVLYNLQTYKLELLPDTSYLGKACYQLSIVLEDMSSDLPGFKAKLKESLGSRSKTLLFIDKQTNYPIRMKSEMYDVSDPKKVFFINQTYRDIKFNEQLDELLVFDTSLDQISEYQIEERQP